MNNLTNLYKHKCEQLQEQINNLKKMLNEVNAPLPTQGTPSVVPPTGIDPRMFDPRLIPPYQKPELIPSIVDPLASPPGKANDGDLWQDPQGGTWQYRENPLGIGRGHWYLLQGPYLPQNPPYQYKKGDRWRPLY